eukprot:scaffold16904_cov101-Isochrysis_galbana.AAC.3
MAWHRQLPAGRPAPFRSSAVAAASSPHSYDFSLSDPSRQSGMVQPIVNEMFATVHAAGSSLLGLFTSCTTFDSTLDRASRVQTRQCRPHLAPSGRAERARHRLVLLHCVATTCGAEKGSRGGTQRPGWGRRTHIRRLHDVRWHQRQCRGRHSGEHVTKSITWIAPRGWRSRIPSSY